MGWWSHLRSICQFRRLERANQVTNQFWMAVGQAKNNGGNYVDTLLYGTWDQPSFERFIADTNHFLWNSGGVLFWYTTFLQESLSIWISWNLKPNNWAWIPWGSRERAAATTLRGDVTWPAIFLWRLNKCVIKHGKSIGNPRAGQLS